MTADFKLILDVPAHNSVGKLALGYDELAMAFHQVIEHSDPQFAIGIFGGWGSGKTTLMRAISSHINPKDSVVVWFSAWRYEKEEHLIVPLLDVVREGVVNWARENSAVGKKAVNAAYSVAGTIGDAIHSLLAGFSLKAGLSDAISLSFDANKALTTAKQIDKEKLEAMTPRSFYHASFRAIEGAFRELTKQGPKRIVVFVDDLDRCLPDGMLEVLESMKLFFDLEGFVFVVGADRRVVELSVDKHYRELAESSGTELQHPVSGASYLRKIFQVPYGLAPVSAEQIDEFLWAIKTSTKLSNKQWQEIHRVVSPHLRYLVDDGGVNPREIKRFINSYTLLRKIKPHLEEQVVLALQTIATRGDWADIQLALLANRDIFIDALSRQIDEPDANHLATVWSSLENLPSSFVTYLNDPASGQKLVEFARNGGRIDEYIFSGEATRSSESSNFVPLFRAFGEILLNIEAARNRKKPARKILDAVENASKMLDSSRETDGRFSALRNDLKTLINDIETSNWDRLSGNEPKSASIDANIEISDKTSDEDHLADLASGWISRVRNMIEFLQELYRAGLA